MALISIGKIDMNLIPMIIGCIFCFLNRLLNQYDGTLLLKNAILTNIVISSSKLFTVIPLLILKFRSNKVNSNEIKSVNSLKKLNIYTPKKKLKLLNIKEDIFFYQLLFFLFNRFSLY